VPLPARTLRDLKTLFNPGPQAIPAGITGLRRQIRQDQPRVLVAVLPAGQQRARDLVARKGDARPAPTRTRPRRKRRQGPPAGRPRGPKAASQVDAQKGMPAQAGDTPKQPRGIQAPISQHDHRPTRRDGRAQPTQQAQPFAAPGALGARGQDHPRHRDRTAAIDHADGQHHKALAQGCRVEGQCQLRALPPTDDPAQQGGKTRLDAQCLALGAPLALGVVVPLAQPLAHGWLRALHAFRQQAAHGAQRTRARQHHPKTPQGQHGGLGLAQMGQMLHDRCPPLVESGLAKHGFPPYGCGSLHTPHFAVWREVHHLLFNKPPLMRLLSPGHPEDSASQKKIPFPPEREGTCSHLRKLLITSPATAQEMPSCLLRRGELLGGSS
jgi:hypothetical protein